MQLRLIGSKPWNKGNDSRIECRCIICNSLFKRYPSDLKKGGGKVCSLKCRGIKNAEFLRENDFMFKKGHPSQRKGKRAWNRGLKGYLSGINNPSWKGGITDENRRIRNTLEYSEWRDKVFKRDNFRCVNCGDKSGGNLQADHIKSFAYFPDLRFDINNGRTLCVSCHSQTETFGGKGNPGIYFYQ